MSAFTGEHSSGLVPREAHTTGDEGLKKPNTGDEVSMSMKITKVEGNELKYTVGDKSPGLLSTSIDKALGNMLKGEEAQSKCSPEYAEGATINLTLVQVAEKHEEMARRGLVSVQGKSIVDLAADSTAWRTQNASRLNEFDACLLYEKAMSNSEKAAEEE